MGEEPVQNHITYTNKVFQAIVKKKKKKKKTKKKNGKITATN